MRKPYWKPLTPVSVDEMINYNYDQFQLWEIPFMRFNRVVNERCTGESLTFSVIRYIGLTKIDLYDFAAKLQKHMEQYNPTWDEIVRHMVDETASICFFTSMPYENAHNVVITYPKRFFNRLASGNIYGTPYNPGDIIDFLESGVI